MLIEEVQLEAITTPEEGSEVDLFDVPFKRYTPAVLEMELKKGVKYKFDFTVEMLLIEDVVSDFRKTAQLLYDCSN